MSKSVDWQAIAGAQEPDEALVDTVAEELDFEDDPWDRSDPEIVWGNPEDERGEQYRVLVRRVLALAAREAGGAR